MSADAGTSGARSGARLRLVVAAFLAIAIALVYAQVVGHAFVEFDDDLYLLHNPVLRSGLDVDAIAWALGGRIEVEGGTSHIWQPLTWISYLIDVELYGLQSAAPFKLTNVAWHTATTWMLLAALTALTGRFGPSAFAAALFALHPIQVEPVAWVSGRRDVLEGFFACATLFAYARYARDGRRTRYAWVVASFAACLASKGSYAALPFLLLLLDYWPLGRLRLGRGGDGARAAELVGEKVPLLVIAAGSVWIHIAAVAGTAGPWSSDPALLARAADGVLAYAETVGRILWPSDLAIVYPTARQQSLAPVPGTAVFAIALAGIAIAGIGAWIGRARGYLLTGWLWFLGMLLPLVGLIPSGLRSMHDRYAYFPMIGIAVLLAFGIADCVTRRRSLRRPAIAAGVAVVAALAFLTWHQIGVWRDSLSLFDHTLAVTQRNAIVHFYRGNTRVGRGDVDGARRDFEAALAIQPDYAQALHNLGQLELREGRAERALPRLERAVALQPTWGQARTHLGAAQWQLGDRETALANLRAGAEYAPRSVDAQYALAAALHALGDVDAARARYRAVLRLDPGHEPARRGLARTRTTRE